MSALNSARTAGSAALLLGQAWLLREALRSRRQRTILREAATELSGASSPRAVTMARDRARARLIALGSRSAAVLDTLELMAALALDRVRLSAETAEHDEERFSALVEQTADVILIVDDGNRIRYASPSARALFGTSALHDLVLTELVEQPERRSAEFLLRHARQGHAGSDDAGSDSAIARADWTIQALDGRTARVEVSCRDLRAEESVGGVVVTLRDVSTQRQLEHELTKRVFHDPLTGLPNRAVFTDRVGQAIAMDAGVTGVLFIDIDEFRAVNDALGREIGDAVLKAVGARLREIVDEGSLVARLGDDEFGVLIRNADGPKQVDEAAARIVEALVIPAPGGENLISCSSSVGVATSAAVGTAHELLSHADLALHAAMAAGTAQWRHYEPSMINTISHRLELRSELGRALEENALVLEYQPIVSLDTRRTIGFEALLRWRHPARGLISPVAFIDLAEETGLIVPIGEWVLATALNDAREWGRAAPPDPPYVSVNVSAQQFRSPGFVDTVHRLLAEASLPPARLVMEITESLLVRDEDKVWEDLKRLRQWGVRIAIDDFGTGYSALGYLRQTPLDIVKLDRIFISTMATSDRQRELVRGIVALTQTLSLSVVAEGIETERQREVAAAAGCAYGQGFLFSRAMSYADAVTWLVTGRTGTT